LFHITALPASFGDCLWVEYGPDDAPNVILIDAGPSVPLTLKDRLQQLAARGGVLELVVVTHVDRDHILGMLTLLDHDFYGVPVRDFWFNGFRHLPGPETFGAKQGERLTGKLLNKGIAWNVALKNAEVMVNDESCPVIDLPGGAKITLLSPDADQLARLKIKWIDVCGEADLYEGIPAMPSYFGEDGREAFGIEAVPNIDQLADEVFKEDTAEANGSSIAFSIEFEGKRVLCGADAFPSRILSSLEKHLGTPPYPFDLVKLPHHGSENNVSQEFIKSLDCSQYLFSTSGTPYKHPSKAAVARVIQNAKAPKLIFNYQSEHTKIWENKVLQQTRGYSVEYGDEAGAFVKLS
jgi:hypothetical protein